MAERNRRYFIRRSYYYETHDSNGVFTGETIDSWKDRVKKELNPNDIKAISVALIFHYKDDHILVNPEKIHGHAVIHFTEGVSLSTARKYTRTGDDKETTQYCRVAGKPADAYRYLLHVTETAISEHKRIYGEDDLILMSPDNSFTIEKFREAMTSAKSRNTKKLEPATYYINQLRKGKISMEKVEALYTKANMYFDYQKNEKNFQRAVDDFSKTKVHNRRLIAIQGDSPKNRVAVERALTNLFKEKKLTTTSLPCDMGNAYLIKDFCSVFDPYEPQKVKNSIYNNCYSADRVLMPCNFNIEELVYHISSGYGDRTGCFNRVLHCFNYVINITEDKLYVFRVDNNYYLEPSELNAIIDSLINTHWHPIPVTQFIYNPYVVPICTISINEIEKLYEVLS